MTYNTGVTQRKNGNELKHEDEIIELKDMNDDNNDYVDQENICPYATKEYYRKVIVYYERTTGKTRADIKSEKDLIFGMTPNTPTFDDSTKTWTMWILSSDHPYMEIIKRWDSINEPDTNYEGYIPKPVWTLETFGHTYKVSGYVVDWQMITCTIKYIFTELQEQGIISGHLPTDV